MNAVEKRDARLSLLTDLETSGSLTATGFSLPPEVSFEQYEAIGNLFGSAHEALKFAIGDWILQGEQIWGEEVYQAVEALGISVASRLQYIRVATRIPIERRVEGLTWSHHRAVAALEDEEQELWLNRAKDSGWSKSDLEEHLRDQKPAATTEVSAHQRKLPGYVVEAVADAAEKVWGESEALPDGTFQVPHEPMVSLARALGETEVS